MWCSWQASKFLVMSGTMNTDNRTKRAQKSQSQARVVRLSSLLSLNVLLTVHARLDKKYGFHNVPPTEAIVWFNKHTLDKWYKKWNPKTLTKGDAVGPSSITNSSAVNGSLGIIKVRKGSKSIMITGKPIAAFKCPLDVSHMVITQKIDSLLTDCLRNGKGRTEAYELYA